MRYEIEYCTLGSNVMLLFDVLYASAGQNGVCVFR